MLRELIHTLRHINAHPLNRGRRAAAFARFASWQFRARVGPRERIVPFAGETRLYARLGLTGVTGNIYSGLHEYQDMGFLLHFLRAGEMFYDVGANVGSYTVLASGAVGARSIAFEPISSTCAMLTRNIELNRISGLARAEKVGIGAEPGSVRFTTELDSVNRALLPSDPSDTPAETVDVSTIDIYAAAEPPTLIKIDVEGFESKVLAGARETLSGGALKAIIIELNGNAEMFGETIDEIAGVITKAGFQSCRYDPLTRALTRVEFASDGPEIGYADNVLFVRDFEDAALRVRTAKPVAVAGHRL